MGGGTILSHSLTTPGGRAQWQWRRRSGNRVARCSSSPPPPGSEAGRPSLGVEVDGLHLPNPFVIGSGPPGTNAAVMRRAFVEVCFPWECIATRCAEAAICAVGDVEVHRDGAA